MRRLPRALALAWAALAALEAAAQAAPAADSVRVVSSVAASGLEAGPAAETWSSTLDAALLRSPRASAVKRAPAGVDAADYAAAETYDVSVAVLVRPGKSGMVRLEYRVSDAFMGAVLADGALQAAAPDGTALADTFWLPLRAVFEASLSRMRRPAPAAFAPSLPRSPVAAKDSWSMETGLLNGQFPGFWVGRGFLGNRIFLRGGVEQALLGYYLGETWGFYSVPLVEPGLRAGVYLNRDGAPLRFYVETAAMARFSGNGLGLDPIAPWLLDAAFGWEWRSPGKRLAVFLELGASVYPACDDFLLAAEHYSGQSQNQSGPFGFIRGSSWAAEVPQFRLGLRCYP